MEPPDEFAELLAGLARGESDARLEFVRRYSAPMLRAAGAGLHRRAHTLADAEDICQTALAEFFARATRSELPVYSSEELLGFALKLVGNVLHAEYRHDHAQCRDIDRLEGRSVEELE